MWIGLKASKHKQKLQSDNGIYFFEENFKKTFETLPVLYNYTLNKPKVENVVTF